jgi:hypothetical protein
LNKNYEPEEQGCIPREHIVVLLLPPQNIYLSFIRNVMPCGKGRKIYLIKMGSGARKKTLGKHTLVIMMTNISKAESLSKHDTNHCIRATCITVLSEACFEARHIVTACIDLCSSLSVLWFLKLKESKCQRRKRQLYSV